MTELGTEFKVYSICGLKTNQTLNCQPPDFPTPQAASVSVIMGPPKFADSGKAVVQGHGQRSF